ncbi:hypothetical protein [Haliscomenobacter sp.]|uniref:hypothetical protein n=1 Tax=Haliscomenobacter sp. TaxID=2717303 RepID=UPI003BA9A503
MHKIYILAEDQDFPLLSQLKLALVQIEGGRIDADSNFVYRGKNYGFCFAQDLHQRFIHVELSTHESHEDLCAIAWQIYVHLTRAKIGVESGYWYYTMLNEDGFNAYSRLFEKRAFSKLDFSSFIEKPFVLKPFYLNYDPLNSYGSYALRAKKGQFDGALDFWVNAIKKALADRKDLNADLSGGSYNPVDFELLETLSVAACCPISSVLEPTTFISAMEMSHEIREKSWSNWFFVETTNEYLLVDLCCP